MKVSVIVPVYNVEKYLGRCIHSLVEQTMEDIEIILVDDGSTDSSGCICDLAARNCNKIRVLHKQNGGLSDARNKGLQCAQGEYILFVDSDDWVEKDMVKTMYATIVSTNADIVISSYFIDYSNEHYSLTRQFSCKRVVYENRDISEGIYQMDSRGMFNVVWNKLYKKSILDEKQILFDENAMPGEDLLFNCEYFKHITKMVLINSMLYHYMRQDENSLAGKYREDLFSKVCRFNACREKLYEHYNMKSSQKYKVCYARTYVDYMFTCIPNIYRVNTGLSQQEKRRLLGAVLEDAKLPEALKELQDKNAYIRLLGFLIKIRNIHIANLILNSLFKIRYNAYGIYLKIRKRIVTK